MDDDRKYKQRGYQESGRPSNGQNGDQKSRPQGPRPPIDVTGPRLPRLVQSVVASRCFHCTTSLSADMDFKSTCPKCSKELHCCKQCAHFEPSTRFQCLKPIPERIAIKDAVNECTLFGARVTVARDAPAPSPGAHPASNMSGSSSMPRNQADARTAFDNLFKK